MHKGDMNGVSRKNMGTIYRVPLLMLWAVTFFLAACGSGGAPTLESGYPEELSKRLATVYVSPTPGDADRRATQIASRPTITLIPPTVVASPTVYIGVFLGESSGEDVPIIDPARYQGTLISDLPTLAAPTCLIPTDPIFGTTWAANTTVADALGCAGEPVTSYVGTMQVFERGAMYFIPSGEIWMIAPGGTEGGRYWYVPQAPPDQGWEVPPPEGLRMPTLGFGAVWKAIDGVRQTLGFARTDEQAASISVQRFDGGALFLDSSAGQVFALVGDQSGGTTYGPF
jgi:hypothetical protein